jgi:hypothetical protein
MKNLKYTDVQVLFPFFYVVLNNRPILKKANQIDIMKKQLVESYKLFTPGEEETQKTLNLIKLELQMDWRIKWVLPLKEKYENLTIFTIDKQSDQMYKNEKIKTIPFFK